MRNEKYLKNVSSSHSLQGRKTRLSEQRIPRTNEKFSQLATELAAKLEALLLVLPYDLPNVDTEIDFYARVRDFQISLISRAMKCTRGSQVKAASLLKIKQTTLNNKIKAYNIVW